MTIRINQIPVDFTLEKEETFADLATSLRAWATGQDLAILGILADGSALGPEDRTPLGRLSAIEVEAVPAGERDLARVAVISRFFALLAAGWEGDDEGLLAELRHEYPAVRQALFPLLAPIAARLTESLQVLDSPWTGGTEGAQAAQRVAHETEVIRRELQDPSEALLESLNLLEADLETIERLPALFQQGSDRDAIDLILGVLTTLETLARRVALVSQKTGQKPRDWDEFTAEIQPFLNDATQALAEKDYILLTDLLEYEVTPRLKTIRGIFTGVEILDPAPDVL